MKWLLLLSLFVISCGDAYSSAVPFRRSFMPENDLWQYDRYQAANITEGEFNGILDIVEEIYTPIFRNFGATFVLERAWEDSTVNAYADQSGSNWIVHMYGGMARRSEMNVLSFGLVACHEIGHHLAGYPFYSTSPWAANEGQSDYFADFVCARKVFASYPTPDIGGTAKSKCDSGFASDSDRAACYKALVGSQALGNLLAVLGGSPNPSYDTPDPSVVSKTADSHPKAQCRLDTMLAGALCTTSIWNDGVIPRNENAVCPTRPKCWFKASADPGPNPTPNPDPEPQPGGDADYLLMGYINSFRSQNRVPVLTEEEALSCAAYIHAMDLGTTGRCQHNGTDGSTIGQRTRSCGYKYGVMQQISCKRVDAKAAMDQWMYDRANRAVLLSRSYRAHGCASHNGYFVCLSGTK